ncbi:uncharacterized protein LOC132301136 [Cornus florida]|uniref:uncharacterized protein LOC132301136 n=1 Tax=Cornus florida TaxID=4283 RepID=UPI00289AF6BB|nr:uncharacterized protein LOC132301136 [Cornus florida]
MENLNPALTAAPAAADRALYVKMPNELFVFRCDVCGVPTTLKEQGLAFRGHDESEHSSNQGNFLQLLKFLANHNEDVKSVALKNASENLKLTSPDIQKDIVNVAAIETISVIISDIGDEIFSIMIDESRDISTKEQMAIVFRYVDMDADVIERFIDVGHVTSTTALSLKMAIDELFCRHGLSITRLCGQGYDGASNMQAMLLMWSMLLGLHVNVVKILHEKQATMVIEALNNGEIESGWGLNQNTTLKRASDTRWGSHYDTLISLISMFSSVIDVLEIIIDDGSYVE